MSEDDAPRTAFVLGKPIKNPADFYGREKLLGRLYEHVLAMQPVAVVGEHRCGNTSVLYQLLHAEVRARYLTPADDHRLIFAFVSCQLASDSPEAMFRRIALAIRRADAEAEVDPEEEFDQAWLERYLESLGDRRKRLVLLLDEVELVADFEEFWTWFEVLVAEYDLSVVASSRTDLSQFRLENGRGPAFFNLFRSEYLGSFTKETVQRFLKEKSEITEFNFVAAADDMFDLAGRFPFYVQLAAAIMYVHASGENTITPAQRDEVRREFGMRTQSLFADAWRKLPGREREVLTRMGRGAHESSNHSIADRDALESLERRGYVVDGRIFSSAFTDFVNEQ